MVVLQDKYVALEVRKESFWIMMRFILIFVQLQGMFHSLLLFHWHDLRGDGRDVASDEFEHTAIDLFAA
jgi:hypothetical protein